MKLARRSTRSSGACGSGRCIGRTRRCAQLYDAYLEQYDVAPSTVAFLKDNMKPALATFGDERIGELRVDKIAAWRKSLPEGKRYRGAARAAPGARGRRALEVDRGQPGGAASRTRSRSRARSTRSSRGTEIDAIDAELDEVGGALVAVPVRDGRPAGGGVRRRVARRRPRAPDVPGAPRVREGPAEGLRQDGRLDARGAAARARGRGAGGDARQAPRDPASPRPRAAGSTSTTGATASGRRASRRRASSTAGSTTCGTRTRRGAWRPGSTSSRWRAGWARA